MQNNFDETEYEEIGNNLRYIADMRLKSIYFLLTISGMLILSVSTALSADSISLENRRNLLYFISIFGTLSSLAPIQGNKLLSAQFNTLLSRAIEIEREAGRSGQYTRTVEKIGRPPEKFISSYVLLVFLGSAIGWCGVGLYTHLFL